MALTGLEHFYNDRDIKRNKHFSVIINDNLRNVNFKRLVQDVKIPANNVKYDQVYV